MKYIVVYLVLLAAFTLVFFIGKKKQKHDYLDIFWGMGFITAALISYLLGSKPANGGLMTLLVILWGGRLTYYLAKRNIGKPEDFRYKAMREKWKKNFELVMYFKMYLLQFALNAFIGFPIVFVNLQGARGPGFFTWLGFLVWLTGFAFEVIGDEQLRRFKGKPENKGKLMTTGLWALTRHPNYFGEAVIWWGLFIISLTGDFSRVFLIYSPLLITFLLVYVSGVPMLEKKYEGRADWEAYKKTTNKFLPGRPR